MNVGFGGRSKIRPTVRNIHPPLVFLAYEKRVCKKGREERRGGAEKVPRVPAFARLVFNIYRARTLNETEEYWIPRGELNFLSTALKQWETWEYA